MYNQFYFQNAVECFMNALKLMPSPAIGGHDAGVLLHRRDAVETRPIRSDGKVNRVSALLSHVTASTPYNSVRTLI